MNAQRDRASAASPIRALLIGTLLVAAIIYFAGLIQNLPYSVETDEPSRVLRAVAMVTNWDPNPHWFGHPASTVFYPLAFLIYVYNAVALGGSFFQPNPGLQQLYEADFVPFYILGRLVTITYGLASLPLLYAVGKRLFRPWTALLGVWLSLTFTLIIANAQTVRSDSAALFFSLLSLWLCLRFYDRPTMANRLWCALAIGLAVSSRYFMVAWALPLGAVELVLLWRRWRAGQGVGGAFLRACVSPLAVLAGFAISTPFFFPDFGTALKTIGDEARSEHIGFDGLSPLGNFWWYVSRALPEAVSWAYLGLAVLGVAVAVRQRRHLQVLLGAFVLAYIVGISLHPLHWQRWLIQVIPLLGLFSAEGVVWLHGALVARLALAGRQAAGLSAALVVAVLAVPAYDMVLFEIRQVTPSTRVRAMCWMDENLPAGSHVLQESYGAPLLAPHLVHSFRAQIGRGATLDDYRQQGVDYLVVTDVTYNRFFNEPERYQAEIAVYNEIFTTLPLIRQFEPSPVRPGLVPRANVSPSTPGGGGGPVISIYRLSEEGEVGKGREFALPEVYYLKALARIEQLPSLGRDATVYFHLTGKVDDGTADKLIRAGGERGLRVRIATRAETLLLYGGGDDHIYVLEATDSAAVAHLEQLGFEERAEERVVLPGGRHGVRFFRLKGSAVAAIERVLPGVGPELRFDNGLRLGRWQAPTDLRGQTNLPLVTAWQVWDQPKPSATDPDWCLSQHLLDLEGRSLAVGDLVLGPARFLSKGDTLLTWSQVSLPAGLGLQESSLELGMFSCWKRDTPAVIDRQGKKVAGGLRLGPFKVGAPSAAMGAAPFPAQVALGGEVRLTGFGVSAAGGPGGTLRLALHWRAEKRPRGDYTVFAQLLGEGKVVAQRDSPPLSGRYPTSGWDQGETVVDEYELALPAGLGPGEYRLIVGMYTPADVRRLAVSGADGRPLGDFVDLGLLVVGPGGETTFRPR